MVADLADNIENVLPNWPDNFLSFNRDKLRNQTLTFEDVADDLRLRQEILNPNKFIRSRHSAAFQSHFSTYPATQIDSQQINADPNCNTRSAQHGLRSTVTNVPITVLA